MTPEEKLNLINTCVKEASLHANHPSSETKKFMEEINRKMEANCITIEVMKNQLANVEKSNTEEHNYIKDALNDIRENQERYMNDMNNNMKDIFNKKANKWVENFLLWAGGIIGSAMLLGLVALIYRLAVHIEN
jgi:hypothetical protein